MTAHHGTAQFSLVQEVPRGSKRLPGSQVVQNETAKNVPNETSNIQGLAVYYLLADITYDDLTTEQEALLGDWVDSLYKGDPNAHTSRQVLDDDILSMIHACNEAPDPKVN